MVDELDRAKALEMRERQAALARTLARGQEREPPLEVDGVRVCLDCGEPIPPERLAARPQSVRCVECKERKEKKERLWAGKTG